MCFELCLSRQRERERDESRMNEREKGKTVSPTELKEEGCGDN